MWTFYAECCMFKLHRVIGCWYSILCTKSLGSSNRRFLVNEGHLLFTIYFVYNLSREFIFIWAPGKLNLTVIYILIQMDMSINWQIFIWSTQACNYVPFGVQLRTAFNIFPMHWGHSDYKRGKCNTGFRMYPVLNFRVNSVWWVFPSM